MSESDDIQKDPTTDASEASAPRSDSNEPRLYPEDQDKVDAFLKRGVNSVERKPFRPILLLVGLTAVVFFFSLFSQLIARWAGVY
jgi:hypothetical protein